MNVWKWGYSALDEHQHSFTHTYKWVFLSSYHHCMWCKFYTFFLRWVQIEPTQILAVAGYKAKGRIQIAANPLAVNSSEKVWNYENMEKKTHSRTTNYLSVKGRGGDIKWTRTYTHTYKYSCAPITYSVLHWSKLLSLTTNSNLSSTLNQASILNICVLN